MSNIGPTGQMRAFFPIGINLNASGNGVFISQRMPNVCILALAAMSNGGNEAVWTAFVSPTNNAPYVGYVGKTASIAVQGGPWVLGAGEFLIIQVSGGTPNDIISGSVFGVQGVNPAAIPAISAQGSLQPVSISGQVPIVTNQTFLGNVSVNPSVVSTAFGQSFTLPANTASLTLECTGNWAPTPGTGGLINVLGAAISYAFLFPPKSTTLPLPGPGNFQSNPGVNRVNIGPETTITLNGIGPSVGTGLNIAVYANTTSTLAETDFNTINGTELSNGQDVGGGGTSSVPMVPAQFYHPATWQSPYNIYTKFQSWPSGDTTVVTPPSGFFLRLFFWSQSVSAGTGIFFFNGSVTGQLTPSQSVVGTSVGDLDGVQLGVNELLQVGNAQTSPQNGTMVIGYTATTY